MEKNDDLCLIKLNGTAGFNTKIEYQTAYQRNREPTKNEDMDDFKKFLGSIILFSEKYSDYFDLRFSWEKESFSQRKDIECAIAKSYGTNNLVIIGYTFPSLNQEIDFKIIEAMSGTLKKIYFQGYDYNDSVRIMRYFQNVYDFKDIVKRKFTPVDSVGFFIPNDIFRVNDSD